MAPDRLESLLEAAYRERSSIRDNGCGTSVGRDQKRQAWQRILGIDIMNLFRLCVLVNVFKVYKI